MFLILFLLCRCRRPFFELLLRNGDARSRGILRLGESFALLCTERQKRLPVAAGWGEVQLDGCSLLLLAAAVLGINGRSSFRTAVSTKLQGRETLWLTLSGPGSIDSRILGKSPATRKSRTNCWKPQKQSKEKKKGCLGGLRVSSQAAACFMLLSGVARTRMGSGMPRDFEGAALDEQNARCQNKRS